MSFWAILAGAWTIGAVAATVWVWATAIRDTKRGHDSPHHHSVF